MKISLDEYKENIRKELIRTYTDYQALYLLAEKYGVDDDIPQPEPTPEPQPEPTPEPSGDPEMVYDGPSLYTIKKGEHVKFTVYLNNCTAKEWQTTCPGEPESIRVEDKWTKTASGYRSDVDIKGVNAGTGAYCVYWKKDEKNKDKWLIINVVVKG